MDEAEKQLKLIELGDVFSKHIDRSAQRQAVIQSRDILATIWWSGYYNHCTKKLSQLCNPKLPEY